MGLMAMKTKNMALEMLMITPVELREDATSGMATRTAVEEIGVMKPQKLTVVMMARRRDRVNRLYVALSLWIEVVSLFISGSLLEVWLCWVSLR